MSLFRVGAIKTPAFAFLSSHVTISASGAAWKVMSLRIEQSHGAVQFEEHFERVCNVCLCLAFEKPFVAALAETPGGVHDEFGIAHERDAAVANEIKIVWWHPLKCFFIGTDLQMNQVVFASIITRHGGQGFPIDAFFVNAQSTPFFLVLKNLVGELIDAGTGFAAASVAGDEPATTELVAFPSQPAELRDMTLA